MEHRIVVDTRGARPLIACVEAGEVCEVFHCDGDMNALRPGALFVGRVVQCLTGIEAAFVDIGLSRHAFLPYHDVWCIPRVGDQLIVAIAKMPLSDKGARVTQRIDLTGHRLVLKPGDVGVGVSGKIEDVAERARLKEVALRICPEGYGLLLRTAAAHADEDALHAEAETLVAHWELQVHVAQHAFKPQPLTSGGTQGAELVTAVRDLMRRPVADVVVDDAVLAQRLKEAGIVTPVTLYTGELTLSVVHGLQAALAAAKQRKLWLPCGGFIVWDRCEAMTVVDVNSGKYVGHWSLEETALLVNLEAAHAIAVQLRQRDIGGIVVIDFIDMMDVASKETLLTAMRQAFAADAGEPCIVGGISALGLVQLTRRKVRGEETR